MRRSRKPDARAGRNDPRAVPRRFGRETVLWIDDRAPHQSTRDLRFSHRFDQDQEGRRRLARSPRVAAFSGLGDRGERSRRNRQARLRRRRRPSWFAPLHVATRARGAPFRLGVSRPRHWKNRRIRSSNVRSLRRPALPLGRSVRVSRSIADGSSRSLFVASQPLRQTEGERDHPGFCAHDRGDRRGAGSAVSHRASRRSRSHPSSKR